MLTNQDVHNAITAEFTRFKREQTSRAHRMNFTEKFTEQYFTEHGEMPNGSVLDRLATLILQDELANKERMKMRNNEYPLMSATQYEYRSEDERSLKAAQDVAVDGSDYRVSTRDSNRRMREIFG